MVLSLSVKAARKKNRWNGRSCTPTVSGIFWHKNIKVGNRVKENEESERERAERSKEEGKKERKGERKKTPWMKRGRYDFGTTA